MNNNKNNNITRLETYINNLKIIISLNDEFLQSIFQQNSINNKITEFDEHLLNSKNLIQKYNSFLDNFLKNHTSIKPSNNNNNIENINNRMKKNYLDVFMKKLSYLIVQTNYMSKMKHFFQIFKNIRNKTVEIVSIKKNINQLKKKKKNLKNIYS
jgi:hypothetical protein